MTTATAKNPATQATKAKREYIKVQKTKLFSSRGTEYASITSKQYAFAKKYDKDILIIHRTHGMLVPLKAVETLGVKGTKIYEDNYNPENTEGYYLINFKWMPTHHKRGGICTEMVKQPVYW